MPQASVVPVNPSALPTLAPADQAVPLPYPAYGTPAPVNRGVAAPGLPQIVTLQQATLIAYAQSPTLAAARAAVEISAAPVLSAQGAILPSLSGTASSSRDHRQAGTTATGIGTTQTGSTTVNGLTFTLRQLIYDGGRVAALIREAKANENASIDTYRRQLQTVAFNVATAYYNTLSAERTTQVAQETVRLDLVQESLVGAQIRAGTAARTDLSTAQLATAQARVAVVRDQAIELNALATLANTLGIDANYNVQPKDDVPALSATSGTITITPAFPTPTYDVAIARANALRPDLASQQQTVISFQNALKAAGLGLFPNLSLNGTYGTNSSDIGGGAFRNNSSIGFGLTLPIYDQGLTRAAVLQARGQVDQAKANLAVIQESVSLNVKQTLVSLVSAYAALTQVNAELSQAQTVLRSTQAQYAAGVTTLPLLLNAQVGISTALFDEVNALYTVRQAEQALLFAEGANAAG